jgi:uncharacterized protein with HEPN domain
MPCFGGAFVRLESDTMTEPLKAPKMGFEDAGVQQQAGLGDFLWDAHAAGTKVLDFTAGRTSEEYAAHEVLRAAVESMLQIVAAALEDVQEYFPQEFARIEHAGTMITLRGLLGTGADTAVWSFVQESLPALMGEVAVLLEDWHGA